MVKNQLNYQEKTRALAKLVRMDEEVVRAAQLGEERLGALFDKAARSKRYQDRVVMPAGWLTLAGLFTSLAVSKPVQDIMLIPFALCAVTYLTGTHFMDKAPAIREEIRQRVVERTVREGRNSPPAP